MEVGNWERGPGGGSEHEQWFAWRILEILCGEVVRVRGSRGKGSLIWNPGMEE